MPVPWTKKPGAAPYLAELDHGSWQVSVPDRTSRQVELAYVQRGADGRLPGMPLPIGTFSATTEAMLAVEMYDEGRAPGSVADLAAAHGFAGPGSNLWLVLPDGVECVLSVDPDAVSLQLHDGTPTCIGTLHRPRLQGAFVAFERPPGIEDPEALDVAILLEILDVRRARDPSDVREPITITELEAWQRPQQLDQGRQGGEA